MTRLQAFGNVVRSTLGVESPSRKVVAHNGIIAGSSSTVYTFPETDSAIVVFANGQQDADAADFTAQMLFQALFDSKPYIELLVLAEEEAKLRKEEYPSWCAKIKYWHAMQTPESHLVANTDFVGIYRSHVQLQILQQQDSPTGLAVVVGRGTKKLPLNY